MERITSRRNPLCLHLKKLGVSRSYRESCGEFICDGFKLLEEALIFGADITAVITASPIPFPLPVETRVFFADRSLINSISALSSAQDILFSCRMPNPTQNDYSSGTHILLDGVQDPGNVGTIIRTANAFGIRSIILTGNCADLYNPKTIRASMGAIFKQRVFSLDLAELLLLKADGLRFIGTASGMKSKDISRVKLKDSIIAIGSEGQGLSDGVLDLCSEIVRIPISQDCESLNAAVAAAIVIWRARS